MKAKIWFLVLILFWACKDKYMPHINYPASGFLVVEGFINTGNGPTTITINRSSPLDSIRVIPEPGAQVEVQSEQGASFSLSETGGGNYSIDQIPIDSSQKYRIHIKTSNGKEYLSELSEVKITPAIDTVEWKAGSDLLTIYVSTHDDRNKSIYYEWYYQETWKYHSEYFSSYQYVNREILPRPDGDTLFTCWNYNQSTEINLASSVNLNSDIIYQFPLNTISYFTTNRLNDRYSILVKQIVLTKEWYEWKQNLKKNTEQLGSIFDAQPSETGGNIHNVADPTEQVIGYIGCTSQTENRIFIDRSQIPPVHVFSGYESCSYDTVKLIQVDQVFGNGSELILNEVFSESGTLIGYTGSSPGCVDCRLHGGTNVKPDFWY